MSVGASSAIMGAILGVQLSAATSGQTLQPRRLRISLDDLAAEGGLLVTAGVAFFLVKKKDIVKASALMERT